MKSLILTAVPPCGAGASAAVADAEAGGDGMPDMPGTGLTIMPLMNGEIFAGFRIGACWVLAGWVGDLANKRISRIAG